MCAPERFLYLVASSESLKTSTV
eukprot:COSAG06_NODE_24776_length_653_cov_0.673285_2_plen_22_part_01